MAKTKIMLVDDHTEFRDILKGFLEERGDLGVIAEASDGIEAVEVALRVRPDLILMDISMPRMDGFTATKEIKRSIPDVSVVFVSFYDDDQYKEFARQAGGDGFVSKANLAHDLPPVLESLNQQLAGKGHASPLGRFREEPMEEQEKNDNASAAGSY